MESKGEPQAEHEQRALEFKQWVEEIGNQLSLSPFVETTAGEYVDVKSTFQTVVLIRCIGEFEPLKEFGERILREVENRGATFQLEPGVKKYESTLPPLKRADLAKTMGVETARKAEVVKPWQLDAEVIFR